MPTYKEHSALHKNSKTVLSFDLDTVCPKQQIGNPCPYCYVLTGRKCKFNAKKELFGCVFNEKDILNMAQEKIDLLNSIGGLRVFAFSDYRPENKDIMKKFFKACYTKKLKTKVITKSYQFINDFVLNFGVSQIQLSVDSIGHGYDIYLAKQLRKKYKKIIIRAVCLSNSDLETLHFANILTLNHGNNGYKNFKRCADYKEIVEKHKDKVCCQTGNCISCPIHCKVKVS